jgi:hypothetical protein
MRRRTKQSLGWPSDIAPRLICAAWLKLTRQRAQRRRSVRGDGHWVAVARWCRSVVIVGGRNGCRAGRCGSVVDVTEAIHPDGTSRPAG